MSELETEHTYQLRQAEATQAEKLKEVHEGYCAAIEELKEKNEVIYTSINIFSYFLVLITVHDSTITVNQCILLTANGERTYARNRHDTTRHIKTSLRSREDITITRSGLQCQTY